MKQRVIIVATLPEYYDHHVEEHVGLHDVSTWLECMSDREGDGLKDVRTYTSLKDLELDIATGDVVVNCDMVLDP